MRRLSHVYQEFISNRLQSRKSVSSRRRSNLRTGVGNVPSEVLETRQLLAATPIAGLSDEFDSADTLDNWQRINEVEGWNADQLEVYDIDATQTGRMVQAPFSSSWYEDYRGALSFKEVSGDFVITTEIHIGDRDDIGGSDADDIPGDSLYSLAGAMIRTPRDITDPLADWSPGSRADDGTNDGENFVFLSAGYAAGDNQFSLEVKTTRNSQSTLEVTGLGQDASVVRVQLARIGDSVIALYQLPGEEWQVRNRYSRPDMPDTVQVGLVSYTDWPKVEGLDAFVQNSTVLTGAAADAHNPGVTANPDLIAGFEFARFVTPDTPEALDGADLTDAAAVSDADLLGFLGDEANIADEGVGGGEGGETNPTAVPIPGLSDEFEDAASLSDWNRVNETEGWNADQLQVFDINDTQNGRLTMVPHTTVWYQSYRGPLAYKLVSGDFAFTTRVNISDRDDIGGSDDDDVPGDADFSLGGVMIRTPRDITDPSEWTPGSMLDDGTNNGENFVFLSLGYGNEASSGGENQFSLEVKTTRNSDSQLELTGLGPDASVAEIQIARIGDTVFTLYRLPGEEWQVHRRYSRPDMAETLQVGMVTYTDWEKANDFDPFYQNSNVLTPDGFDPTPGQPFNPDLVAGFDYARYVSLNVPESLGGVDLLSDATDEQLLSFLGDGANLIEPVGNTAPVIEAIDDQTMSIGSQLVIDLEAYDPDGDDISIAVAVEDSVATQLREEFDLFVPDWLVDWGHNWGGESEKWLRGNGDTTWFFLLPDGSLNMWTGSFAGSEQVGDLSVDYYDDPQLLLDASGPALNVEVVEQQLVITSNGDLGAFDVDVIISDGESSAATVFAVAVTNTAPVLSFEDQITEPGATIELQLPTEDADGHALEYSIEVLGGELQQLDTEHGFWSEGEYWTDYLGQNERWIRDEYDRWFYLLPNGELHQWEGSFEDSPLIASLDPEVYDDPSLLTDPAAPLVQASIEDGVLTITAAAGFTDEVHIRITASDGYAEVSTEFRVSGDTDATDLVFASLNLDDI